MEGTGVDLFGEMLVQALISGELQMTFNASAAEVIEEQCYIALQKIKAIIEDDSLDDRECFQKIEQIVCTLEEIGSSGGNRHDVG